MSRIRKHRRQVEETQGKEEEEDVLKIVFMMMACMEPVVEVSRRMKRKVVDFVISFASNMREQAGMTQAYTRREKSKWLFIFCGSYLCCRIVGIGTNNEISDTSSV